MVADTHVGEVLPELPAAVPAAALDRMPEVVERALGLIGIRYKRGAASVEAGFDCSGLVAYVFDASRGIKLFADQAFYAAGKGEIVPFLLKKDAEAYAGKISGKVVGFDDAVKLAMAGDRT